MSDQIFDQIKSEILSGALSAGESLPSERELCDSFGSSRTAVREAVRQLERLGLVESRQGARRTVRAQDEPWALALLRDLLLPAGLPDSATVAHLLELRRDFLELLLRRAAHHGTDEDWRELRALAAEQAREQSDEAYLLRDMDFFSAVARATRNPLYAMVFGTFVEALRELLPHLLHLLPRLARTRPLYGPIVDSLEAGEPGRVLLELRANFEAHDDELVRTLGGNGTGRG